MRASANLLGYSLQRKAKSADMALKMRRDRQIARYKKRPDPGR